MTKIDFSIIIPHKDSLDSLPRLINSIPYSDKIEIIIIDNSNKPINVKDIASSHKIKLFHSSPLRFAGGARNVGIENALGKWLLFADADDFFSERAFDIFYSYINDDADLIYFRSESVYDDTLLPSDRSIMFNTYIDDFLSGNLSEMETRINYVVPWGKMVRRCFVEKYHIRFDEVLAANDVMFSTLAGYYAKKFSVDNNVVYVVTTRKGSLSNRKDLPVIESRYNVFLRRNAFLKKNGLSKMQASVMVYLYASLSFGISPFLSFLKAAKNYRQNILIGFSHWFKTAIRIFSHNKRNIKYITK